MHRSLRGCFCLLLFVVVGLGHGQKRARTCGGQNVHASEAKGALDESRAHVEDPCKLCCSCGLASDRISGRACRPWVSGFRSSGFRASLGFRVLGFRDWGLSVRFRM